MNILDKESLSNSLVVFDTSALIELYYYPENILTIVEKELLKRLSNRLWLPYRVKLEYEEKKDAKRNVPLETYNSLLSKGDSGHLYNLEKKLKDIECIFKTLKEYTYKEDKHPFLDIEALSKLEVSIEKSVNILTPELENIKSIVNEKVDNFKDREDPVEKIIRDNFQIGRKFSFSEILEITQEGEVRFKFEIPPGWADNKSKRGVRKYHDLIIWKQICEISKKDRKDIILITNDYAKDDWCNSRKGSKYIDSPKRELVDELEEISGYKLRMFSLFQFLEFSSKVLEFELDTSVIKQIKIDKDIKVLHVTADNKSQNCWGISQTIEGNAFVSDKNIRVHVNYLALENEKEKVWNIPRISVNIAYENENGRWGILKKGEDHSIDARLTAQGEMIEIIDFDLVVDRSDIESLDNLWLVFQIDTLLENHNPSYGTMYNHWKGLK